MLARSGFYKSGDVEVEKNIIIRCERLDKVFITEVSWARRFLLYICTSVLLYTIVLNLFHLFTGLFLTFVLHFVWSWGGGASEMVQIGLERWASNTPAGLLDTWLLPDVRPASAFLAWCKPETHLQSRNPLPALTFDLRMSCFRTAAHSDAASPPFQLGARLQSCQADARQSGMTYEEQSDSLLCFCKYDFNASEAFLVSLFCLRELFSSILWFLQIES